MTFEARDIVDRLRTAEHREIRDGESQFAGDLAQALSVDAIAQGVHIDFGADGVRMAEALTVLGIPEQVRAGGLRLREVLRAGRLSVSNLGSAIGVLQDQNILTSLDLIQTDAWRVETAEYARRIRTPEASHSIMSFVVPVDGDVSTYSETAPAVTVSARYQYEPQLYGRYEGYGSAAPLVESAHEKAAKAGGRIALVLSGLDEYEARLQMPARTYQLGIGVVQANRGNALIDVYSASHRYNLIEGRLLPAAPLGQEE